MKRIFLGLSLLIISSLAFASPLQDGVDQLITSVDPNINMGIVVVDLNTGETLYQRNAEQAFVPASNMKLFSDAAALLILGPDYRFQNQLSTNATSLDKGVLNGSVYLHLPGDPTFSQTHLEKLLSELSMWGIRRIAGNVVLVSNNSAVSAHAPGRSPSDFKYSYGAPVAPVVLDENSLSITVNPSYKVGAPAFVEFHDESTNLPLNNQVKTAQKPTGCGLDFNMDQNNHVTVRGCVGVGQWAVQQSIAIQNPLRYAEDAIRYELAKRSIRLDGQVVLGQAPASSLLLASESSKPIKQIMADTLKPSDNLYADSLFLHAATKLNGTPLNWQEAQPVVKNFLQQQTGINMQNAVLTDGSGLSRQDQLTPQQTVDLLRFLHDHFPLSYEYIAALPIAGVDGTLERRFRKPAQQGMLRAKTGTMTGVISLSGYLYTANAHTLAFAIFINKKPKTSPNVSGHYRALVDSICDYFLQQKPDNNYVATTTDTHSKVAFQQQPTQADQQHRRYAKWRQLETAVKNALKDQAIVVLFRGNQLVLKDKGADINKVWTILQTLSKKYSFAVTLNSKSAPAVKEASPLLLWVRGARIDRQETRVWTLNETIS